MRCDNSGAVFFIIFLQFQSTHLREVRQMTQKQYHHYEYFNPRTYVRCDTSLPPTVCSPADFNPRTYVRCDNICFCIEHIRDLFQSTHLREVRPPFFYSTLLYHEFQSTHLREVRHHFLLYYNLLRLFQSTHLREVRLAVYYQPYF